MILSNPTPPSHPVFDVYFSLISETPAGARPLWTGEWIYECESMYPDFWRILNEKLESGTVSAITNDDYEISLTQYGQCGSFVLNGSDVRLPKITRFLSSIESLSDFGIVQNDEIKSHTHAVPRQFTDSGSGWPGSGDGPNYDSTFDTLPTGGDETRPKNIRYALFLQIANSYGQISGINVSEFEATTANCVRTSPQDFSQPLQKQARKNIGAQGLLVAGKNIDIDYDTNTINATTGVNAYRSLSAEQETVLLNAGTYDGKEVESGEIFTTASGIFGQYSSVVNPNIEFVAHSTTNPLLRVAYGNEKFVTVRNKVIVYSDDGINYTDSDITLDSTSFFGAIFFQGKFFVYDFKNGATYTSENGVDWTKGAGSGLWYNNSLGISCAEGIAYFWNNNNTYRYSTDGITWTDCTQKITGIAYHDGLYVGCSGDDPYYSTDGLTWTKGTGSWKNLLCDVAYGNGVFVAISSSPYGGDTAVSVSSDGKVWTTHTTMPATSNDTYTPKIIFADGKFVVVRKGNVACYSEDGITWTSVTIPEWSGNTISLVYGKGKYIASRDYSGTYVNVLEFGAMIRTLDPLSYTKEQVDTLLAPNVSETAPDTTTVGRVGQIYIDSATSTAYLCVGADTAIPAYTWKQITNA